MLLTADGHTALMQKNSKRLLFFFVNLVGELLTESARFRGSVLPSADSSVGDDDAFSSSKAPVDASPSLGEVVIMQDVPGAGSQGRLLTGYDVPVASYCTEFVATTSTCTRVRVATY